jgi:SNF2 family DNA or RNA helicase
MEPPSPSKKFKSFLQRNKLDPQDFQIDCYAWCYGKEEDTPLPDLPVLPVLPDLPDHTIQTEIAHKPGGILALEMGLGKTIIMLGLVKCNIKKHTLIILPRSLLDQWEKNVMLLTGCKPVVYHGSRPKNMKMTLLELTSASQVIITTYGQISMPSVKQMIRGRALSLLHQIAWDRIICDEAHHVSHHKTNEYNGVIALKTAICWLVTGTPIQNNCKELYTLYSMFGLTHISSWYNTNERYADAAKKYVYYNTKAGVGIQIPKLHENTIFVKWENVAEEEFAWHLHSLLTFCNVPQKSIASTIEKETEDKKALRMKYLSRARQVCVYPPMLSRVISKFNTMLSTIASDSDSNSGSKTKKESYGEINMYDIYNSQSKMNQLLKTLLARKDNGCGKIIFCHYYTEIDAIEEHLQSTSTLRIAKFDGRVPNSERANILSKPVDVLIAQIKMCREGLNLQENYSEVYLPSPHFNPATEQQAIARCWRIGQKKEVHVFRYIHDQYYPQSQSQSHPQEGVLFPNNTNTDDANYDAEDADEDAAAAEDADETEYRKLTMDMFTAQLHIKKQKFVDKLSANATTSRRQTPPPPYQTLIKTFTKKIRVKKM